jgi:hypothetical protein
MGERYFSNSMTLGPELDGDDVDRTLLKAAATALKVHSHAFLIACWDHVIASSCTVSGTVSLCEASVLSTAVVREDVCVSSLATLHPLPLPRYMQTMQLLMRLLLRLLCARV